MLDSHHRVNLSRFRWNIRCNQQGRSSVLKRLCSRLLETTGDVRASSFLFQRISVVCNDSILFCCTMVLLITTCQSRVHYQTHCCRLFWATAGFSLGKINNNNNNRIYISSFAELHRRWRLSGGIGLKAVIKNAWCLNRFAVTEQNVCWYRLLHIVRQSSEVSYQGWFRGEILQEFPIVGWPMSMSLCHAHKTGASTAVDRRLSIIHRDKTRSRRVTTMKWKHPERWQPVKQRSIELRDHIAYIARNRQTALDRSVLYGSARNAEKFCRALPCNISDYVCVQ